MSDSECAKKYICNGLEKTEKMAVESYGNVLPEDCIANALSRTSPKDACRLSAVSSTFRSASQSDIVWGRFLPADYRDLISHPVDGPDSFLSRFRSKKDLYMHLCDHPILVDGGRKSFSMEKCSGNKCYMIAARDLFIFWSDTPQYWEWISLPQSRFPEVAELIDVCWLEIQGKINTKMLSPGTCYVAYLVFTRKMDARGFNKYPAETFVELNGHPIKKHRAFLDPDGVYKQRPQPVPRTWGRLPSLLRPLVGVGDAKYPKTRSDGWMEVELGEYSVKGGEDGDLEFGLMEVRGYGKKGIVVQGIEVRPKALRS